jgi:beta-1,4-mannosyl-glycoprotein beta-1,4-N-acetylglucosaminyltransferase|tara:strand:+ start:1737 stop:2540 length:804 start_codon:yes stop_codon:yes gene_type:complete
MAIFDCFQYFNEDHVLDLRFHVLNEKVDYFVISESTKTHQGKNKKLNFDINNFSKFKHKIKYIVADYQKKIDFQNHVGGESLVEQHQRNCLSEGLVGANDNDLIILSDSDEIPDLSKLNQIKKNTKFTAFSQKMFMYKLNLQNLDESNWIGSKISLKKNFPLPQKLRNLKFKEYPFWRFDKIGLQIIKGGWHFSFLQKPSDIANKIKSYSHGEFNKNEITDEKNIEQRIANNQDIFGRDIKLEKILIDETYPKFIRDNKSLLSKWIT